MLTILTNICLAVMDFFLAWSLHMPKIVPLILLGIGEALVITLIQKWATNQDLLKRMKFDRARLKTLTREAKQKGDKDAVKRYRSTGSMIGGRLMKAEILPIFLSVLPIAFIATWAFTRMPYLPLEPGKTIVVEADFPASAIGNIVSMVPPATGGIDCTDGWIQKVVERYSDDDPVTGATRAPAVAKAAPASGPATSPGAPAAADAKAVPKHELTGGKAIWQLRATATAGLFDVPIHYQGQVFPRTLRIGGTIYEPPIDYYDPDVLESVEVKMPEYKPLDLLPPMGVTDPHAFWHIPPWLVGDLILVIPLSLLFRPLLRVY